MLWLAKPRSRYACLQSLVAIVLSYELLFGNESVVSRWMAELGVGGLLVSILAILVMPKSALQSRWFINGLVGIDTLMSAAAVYLAGNAREDFYLSFFLLILIATSVRSLGHMLALSMVVCIGYGGLLAEGVVTTGELSVGQMMGVPVLLMMGVFYGLTLEELGSERRRGEGLSHRLAELRLEEEHLLLTRDRLLHETAQLKSALAAAKRGEAASQSTSEPRVVVDRTRNIPPVENERRVHMERLAEQVATMLQDIARQTGRESGALRAKLKRDDPLIKHVEQVLLAGERTATVATQLQALLQHEPVKRELCSLNTVLGELELTIREMLPAGIILSLDLAPEGGFVEADPGMVEYIILHLVMNARDSMITGGHLALATRSIADEGAAPPAARRAQLIVRDTGCGMSGEAQARLLEPFYTTKSRGSAWGMGLSKVQTLVDRLGGTLSIASQSGRGTEITIAWPRLESSQRAKIVPSVEPTLCADGVERILVVEEDECLRKWTVAALRRARYQVLEAQSGVEAMLLAQQEGGNIRLVLCNLVMPEISGAELAERLFSQRSIVKAIFTSNYPEEAIKSHRISSRYYLQKPYRQDELLRKVRDVLDAA